MVLRRLSHSAVHVSCHYDFLWLVNQRVTALSVLDFHGNSFVNYTNNIIMHMWETLGQTLARPPANSPPPAKFKRCFAVYTAGSRPVIRHTRTAVTLSRSVRSSLIWHVICHVKFLQSYNQSVTPLRVLDFTINSPVNYRNNIIMHMWETLGQTLARLLAIHCLQPGL